MERELIIELIKALGDYWYAGVYTDQKPLVEKVKKWCIDNGENFEELTEINW